jgi:uncharacterized HAD superfamily protein
VLPRVEAAYGVALTYDDIVDWQLPIIGLKSSSNIAREIVAAQGERDYVLTMPMHAGAREMLETLRQRYRIVVLTARSGKAFQWSEEWLTINDLPFDAIAGSKEAMKSAHGVDALVDDYLGNAEDFLRNSRGPVVLVDQPWNRVGRDALAGYLSSKRLTVVASLTAIPSALAELVL